jgi:transcriptional regulator with XRE-family HTH domain
MLAFVEWVHREQEKGLSQKVIAERIGTTQSHLSRLLSGKCTPQRRIANAIFRESGIPQSAWDEPEEVVRGKE